MRMEDGKIYLSRSHGDTPLNRLRWIKKGATELPSPGAHLTVNDSCIFVSTTHDSHICYSPVPASQREGQPEVDFVTVYNDARQRHATHHLVYNLPDKPLSILDDPNAGSSRSYHDTIILLTDKTCSATGFLHSKAASHKSSADTLFEACLPRSVIRIHRADIRPPWRRPYIDTHVPFTGIAGVVADDILGACSDGTIYSFTVLSLTARRLLRLIQNLIEAKQKRDPAAQYSIIKHRSTDLSHLLQNGAEGEQEGRLKARDVDPVAQERGDAAPRFNHIDGDLIIRFLEEDGDLMKLVRDGCEKDVEQLYNASLTAVLNEGEREGKIQGSTGSLAERGSHWLGDLLMPVL